MIEAGLVAKKPEKSFQGVVVSCPVAGGHPCDMPDYLRFIPEGQVCHKDGKCLREFVPEVKEAISHRIGVVGGFSSRRPFTSDEAIILQAAISRAYSN